MDVDFGPGEQILWPASVLAGTVMCAAVYAITREVSSRCFKGYNGLNEIHRVEWNNRGFSTFHALVAAAVSFYLLVISDLFSKDAHNAIIIDRKSWLSDAMFGVSLGYFLTDLAMILWHFPSLGGKEYLLHHGLSIYAISLALLSGKGHVYILMVLFTEATTPFVNLRWYLDLAGRKGSKLLVQWAGIVCRMAGCSDRSVRLFLRSYVPPLRSGEDSLPGRILQHTDGAAGALDDEPHLVPEDMQGDGESPVQNEAKWKRKS